MESSAYERSFVRLQISDIATDDPFHADFDGDGVSNEAELAQGTDPLAARDDDQNSLFDDWERFHFGQPGADPQGDADGDGLTNLQEAYGGGNPNNNDTNGDNVSDAVEFATLGAIGLPADTDGDTVPDASDAFPTKQQLALPWASYALVELDGSGDLLPSYGTSVNHHWQALTLKSELHPDESWSHYWTRLDWLTGSGSTLVLDEFTGLLGLGDDGAAYGSIVSDAERWLPNGEVERFKCLNESTPRYDIEGTEEYNNTTNWHQVSSDLSAFSKGGVAVGMSRWRNWHFVQDPNPHFPPYRQALVGVRFHGSNTLPTELPHILENTYHDSSPYPTACNDHGLIFAYGRNGASPLNSGYVWTLSGGPYTITDIGDRRVGSVNNSGTAVGYWRATPFSASVWENDLASEYDLGTGDANRINNQSQIVGHDDVGVDLRGALTWRRNGQLNRYEAQPLNIGPWKPAKWRITEANDLNEDGVIAATAIRTHTDEGVTIPEAAQIERAVLLVPIEFKTSEIAKGFDYPMRGDPPRKRDGTSNGEQDDTKPEWWTSVGQGFLLGDGYNLNQHVIADVNTDHAATMLDIRVAPGSGEFITVSPEQLTGKETPLTIRGEYVPDAENHRFEIEVIDRTPTPRTLRTLNVASLVDCEIPVRICYVYDGSYGPDVAGQNLTRVRDPFRATEEIVNHLNYVFRQACVRFEAHPSSGPLRVDYDGWEDSNNVQHDRNDRLDAQAGDLALTPELLPFDQLGLDPRIPTIFVVNRMSTVSRRPVAGLTATTLNNPTRWAFVQTNPFLPGGNNFDGPAWEGLFNQYLNICAHEVGHILDISTRDFGGWTGLDPDREHDAGLWPFRYNLTKTLMNPTVSARRSDVWIRHEDWDRANVSARAIAVSLQ